VRLCPAAGAVCRLAASASVRGGHQCGTRRPGSHEHDVNGTVRRTRARSVGGSTRDATEAFGRASAIEPCGRTPRGRKSQTAALSAHQKAEQSSSLASALGAVEIRPGGDCLAWLMQHPAYRKESRASVTLPAYAVPSALSRWFRVDGSGGLTDSDRKTVAPSFDKLQLSFRPPTAGAWPGAEEIMRLLRQAGRSHAFSNRLLEAPQFGVASRCCDPLPPRPIRPRKRTVGEAARKRPFAEVTLLASDGAVLDHFGRAVSVPGDVAVVGAAGGDDNGPQSGSAQVFPLPRRRLGGEADRRHPQGGSRDAAHELKEVETHEAETRA
jgi:hypothetical protein